MHIRHLNALLCVEVVIYWLSKHNGENRNASTEKSQLSLAHTTQ